MLQDLAVRGSSKVDDLEVAAFIVKGPDGAVRCLMWPHTANRRAEEYHGSVPEGTVAIAHTHPLFAELPSRGDVEQSKRIGLPMRFDCSTSPRDGSSANSGCVWAMATVPSGTLP